MTLKDRIKELAKQRGISLPVLEADLGFGNSTIVKWDKSTPNAEKLNAVAQYFGVTMDYLLNGTSNTTSSKKGIAIKVLGRVAAGIPIDAIEEIVDTEEITEEIAAEEASIADEEVLAEEASLEGDEAEAKAASEEAAPAEEEKKATKSPRGRKRC